MVRLPPRPGSASGALPDYDGELPKRPFQVMALHALAYCERLFYLEEIEGIHLANDRVFSGRELHEKTGSPDSSWRRLTLASDSLGLRGQVDFIDYADAGLVPVEHKRGRANQGQAWPSDKLQVIAYSALLEEATRRAVPHGEISYHADGITVRVPFNGDARAKLEAGLQRARELAVRPDRPPVATHPQLCPRCSLAPVCLPEEERVSWDPPFAHPSPTPRLFPKIDSRQPVHVATAGARVAKQGDRLVVHQTEGKETTELPIETVGSLCLHGAVQICSQALHFATARGIAVSWFSSSGNHIGTIDPGGVVQRKLRQYEALRAEDRRLRLSRQLIATKVGNQLALLRRARQKNRAGLRQELASPITAIVDALRHIRSALATQELLGSEGAAAKPYFATLGLLVRADLALREWSGHPGCFCRSALR